MGGKINPITGELILTPNTFSAPVGHLEIKKIYIDKDSGFVVVEYNDEPKE